MVGEIGSLWDGYFSFRELWHYAMPESYVSSHFIGKQSRPLYVDPYLPASLLSIGSDLVCLEIKQYDFNSGS